MREERLVARDCRSMIASRVCTKAVLAENGVVPLPVRPAMMPAPGSAPPGHASADGGDALRAAWRCRRCRTSGFLHMCDRNPRHCGQHRAPRRNSAFVAEAPGLGEACRRNSGLPSMPGSSEVANASTLIRPGPACRVLTGADQFSAGPSDGGGHHGAGRRRTPPPPRCPAAHCREGQASASQPASKRCRVGAASRGTCTRSATPDWLGQPPGAPSQFRPLPGDDRRAAPGRRRAGPRMQHVERLVVVQAADAPGPPGLAFVALPARRLGNGAVTGRGRNSANRCVRVSGPPLADEARRARPCGCCPDQMVAMRR